MCVRQRVNDKPPLDGPAGPGAMAARGREVRQSDDVTGMRRLYALETRLSRETDLQAALDAILAAATDYATTDRGVIQLVSEDGQRLQFAAHRGYPQDSRFLEHFSEEGSEAACDAARRQRQRLVIDDVERFEPLAGTVDLDVARAEGIRATHHTPMITREGELVGVLNLQFRVAHRPDEDEGRFMDLLAWTAADFVARHQAVDALRRSEERLRRVLETDAVGVILFNYDGIVTDANDVFLRMTGFTRHDVASGTLDWRRMTPPEWLVESEAAREALAATGRIGPYEKEYFTATGERRWMLFAGRDLGDGAISE